MSPAVRASRVAMPLLLLALIWSDPGRLSALLIAVLLSNVAAWRSGSDQIATLAELLFARTLTSSDAGSSPG